VAAGTFGGSVRLLIRSETKANRIGFTPSAIRTARGPHKNLIWELRMLYENKTRFKRTEDALRFHFRLHELLHSGRTKRFVVGDLPMVATPTASNAIDDYQRVGWCMQGLSEIDLWLLSEVYGPTSFGVHRRSFSQACRAGRREFPNQEFRLRQVGVIHRHAIGVVRQRLRELGMIPPRQIMSVAQVRRRLRTPEGRARVHGSHAANE
jgi:hypothetical protein